MRVNSVNARADYYAKPDILWSAKKENNKNIKYFLKTY